MRIKQVNLCTALSAMPGMYKPRSQSGREPNAAGNSEHVQMLQQEVQRDGNSGPADVDQGKCKGTFRLYEGIWTLFWRCWEAIGMF